jgi:hypothetical protein
MPFARFACLRASQDSGDSPSLKFPAAGVGSRPREDEDPLATVGRSGVTRGYKHPFRIEPEVGQVSEYGT